MVADSTTSVIKNANGKRKKNENMSTAWCKSMSGLKIPTGIIKKIGGEKKKMNTQKKCTGIILTAIMVASVFAMGVTMVSADPQGATVSFVSETQTPDGTSAGSDVTVGGNITEADLGVDAATDRWAGYYGNVTGTITLGDGSHNLYQWTCPAPTGGVVIASTADSGITWSALANGAAADIDTQWGFSSGMDQAADTFGTNDDYSIGGVSMNTCPAAHTTGSWKTGVIKDASSAASKEDLLSAVNIRNDNATFNSEVHDYEMIVPTNETVSETYYFYLEL